MRIVVSFIFSLFLVIQLPGQGDPLKVEVYELPNGLTVFLNEDHTMPMVHGMVVVKGGSKRDPADATGIAHYFEHIMFKGTDQLGTIDYEKEKVYLDSIKILYDRLGVTEDETKRSEIQIEINRISLKAAEYAVPNEFAKIIDEMGGTGTNASTGKEYINYYNSFPPNQIEKWLELYSHRLINPVFRLFQSELETIYEEKNMDLDDPVSMMFETYLAYFFKNSPHGQQSILGTVDDLKNPSLSKMAEYFETYYVANNMALILSGDFNTGTVKPMIKDKFGRLRSGPDPGKLEVSEEPFKGREFHSERMTPIKVGIIGFRSIPRNHEDELKFELVSNLLSNYAGTGMLDELVNDNKLMAAMPVHFQFAEFGGYNILYIPRIIGQPLKKAEELVMETLDRLKEGDFSDTLLRGVKTELRIDYETNLEDMRWRTYMIEDAFVYGMPWETVLAAPDRIDSYTRDDVISIANEYFGENRLAFYSKMGFPKKTKLEKPPYDAVESSSSEKQSEYAKKIGQMPILDMKPHFIDFQDDVNVLEIAPGVTAFVSRNPINSVFSLNLKFGKGSYRDPLVDQTSGIVMYASPDNMDYQEFRQKLQLLGSDVYAHNDLSYTTLEISGLEENLDQILVLVNELINRFSVEEKQVVKLVQEFQLELKYEKKDLQIESEALYEYAMYGERSDYLSRLDESAVKSLTPKDLINKFNEITGYEFEVHYCGQLTAEEFKRHYMEHMTIPDNLASTKGYIEKERNPVSMNTIVVLDDKKAVQSHINIYVKGEVNDEQSRTALQGFNQYIGGSMNAILFQEIREFRSLAYGIRGSYRSAFDFEKPGHFAGWLTTQSDKTTDALEIYRSILGDMPRKPDRMESVRKNLTLSINANQPMFRNRTEVVSRWMEQGYTEDPRKSRYDHFLNMEFSEIGDFFEKNLKGKPWLVTIAGDTKRINMEELAKYGSVQIVKLNQIFN